MHGQWRSRVEVPHFIRSQAMQCREVLAFEKKVNSRRRRPRPAESRQGLPRNHQLRPVRLPKIPALRMPLQPQLFNPVLRVRCRLLDHAKNYTACGVSDLYQLLTRGSGAVSFREIRASRWLRKFPCYALSRTSRPPARSSGAPAKNEGGTTLHSTRKDAERGVANTQPGCASRLDEAGRAHHTNPNFFTRRYI